MDLKNIPILGDIDFSDPAKRKSSIRICLAGAMLILALIAVVINAATRPSVDETQQQVQYNSPEVPLGEDGDNLRGKTIRDVSSSRRGRAGASAKDLFSENIASQDPLSALKGQVDGEQDSESDGAPSFIRDANKSSKIEQRESSVRSESRKQSSSSGASKNPESKEKKSAGPPSAEELSKELTDGSHPGAESKRRRLYEAYGLDPDTGQPVNPQPSFTSSGAGQGASQPPSEPKANEKDQSQSESEPVIEQARVQIRKSGGVSAFGLNDSGTGSSLSSLGDESEFVTEDPSHPFKVKFAYDEKVSSGQRVTIRLCEDMVVDGVLIPTNTHLFATCQVGERLKLSVASIDINGKIYTLNYSAYDNDGVEGLYCPQSEASKITKKIGEEAGQIASQAVQSALTGYPSRIFQSGASIFKSKNGNVTISVTAGYTFYLIQNQH